MVEQSSLIAWGKGAQINKNEDKEEEEEEEIKCEREYYLLCKFRQIGEKVNPLGGGGFLRR